MSSSQKNITLCADDYGLNPAVSLGIRELVQIKRLSAVSCMVNFPDFSTQAKALTALDRGSTALGLHFNLTEGEHLSSPGLPLDSLKSLLLKAHFRKLDLKQIRQELQAQVDCFCDNFGFMPHFIDGHQHVHQFPGISNILLQFWKENIKSGWIRSTWPFISPAKFKMKASILAMTGGWRLQRRLKSLSIPHNSCFAGIHDFSGREDYGQHFRVWLSLLGTHTLIMCHPGYQFAGDPLGMNREAELLYFKSPQFLEDCEQFGAVLQSGIYP